MGSLCSNEKLLGLELAQEKKNVDILGLADMKRCGENKIKTKKR